MTYFPGTLRAVDTGDTYFSELAKENISGRNSIPSRLKRSALERRGFTSEPPLKARIEYARFIVDCPNCGSAEFAFEDKLFWCTICNNSDIDGKVRRVRMPAQRKNIENALSKRKIINRHWKHGETVKDLEGENKKYGVRVE